MNILIYFREKNFGGIHTYLTYHIPYLVRAGHNIYVTYSKDSTKKMFEKLGAQTFPNRGLRRKIKLLSDFYEIYRTYIFFKKNNIDCVFSHTSKGGVIARLAAYFARIPKRIHTVHAFSFHEFSSSRKKIIYSNIEKLMATITTHMICVNNHDKEIAISNKIINPKKISTIYNGVNILEDNELLTNSQKEDFLKGENLSINEKIILYVGRLDPPKNPASLIDSFAQLPNSEIDAKLIMIGTGSLQKKCTDKINYYHLHEKVKMIGFRKDVYKWYQIATIYILLSQAEGMPLTLLEAMGCGIFCIATNVRGCNECITNNHDGILVPYNDCNYLTNKLFYYLNNIDLTRKIGTNARNTVKTKHSLNKMCCDTLEILTQK